jgi:hypothetical protein
MLRSIAPLVDSVMGPGEVVPSPEVDDRGVTHSTSDGVAATSQSKSVEINRVRIEILN